MEYRALSYLCGVRAFIAISFLLLYLFSNTELDELARLPMLIHHYIEHKATDKHLTFAGFLKEHYGEMHHPTASQHHKQDHQRLPFKVHDHNFLGNTSIVPLAFIRIEPLTHNVPQRVALTRENSFYSHFLADIWQPPRA